MKRSIVITALLAILVIAPQAFSQSSFASLSGTINDSTGAIVPGVKVTATNVGTGITNTALSNSAGVYNFPSLQPGTYKVSAESSGFQTQTFTDVALGNAAQVRLNFKLQVAGITESVEVSVAADRVLLESSSSSGEVLVQESVQALPLVNSNALDLIRITSAYVPTGNFINNANEATIAGVSITNLNIQRDGVNVSDVRYPAGIHAPTQINPDLVSEFRMVTAPVDAEVGRGNSQVQVLTKSGSNAYHGGAVWEVQNSALDSTQWSLNRSVPKLVNWRNINQYTLSLGGPIVKNKTFFFVLWNGQISRGRDAASAMVLTPCARKGIFRYFDNWSNGLYNSAMALTGSAPSYASVDSAGNPVAPPALRPSMLNADGTHVSDDPANPNHYEPHNGILRYASVFGIVQNPDAMAADCSNAIVDTATGVSGGGWDTYRKAVDASGFVGDSTGFTSNFLEIMPAANNYDTAGDGLNTASHKWTRSFRGNDNLYNVGEYNQRKQINLKIDHNFNDRHRINGSWSYEKGWSDNNLRVWPTGYGGFAERRPQVLTVNFSSTLRSNLLNEVRFGMARTGTNMFGPLDNPETGKNVRESLNEVNGLPLVVNPGTGGAAFNLGNSHFIGGRWNSFLTTTNWDSSPRYTYADTLVWTKGAHSFKMGGEFRISKSRGAVNGTGVFSSILPTARGGNPQGVAVNGIESTASTNPSAAGLLFRAANPGINGNNNGNHLRMQNLASFLAASLSSVSQNYFINSPNNLDSWNDPLTEPTKIRNFQQKEFAFFFKDDWKVTNILTLNLGLRWEYYGVPFYKNGLTVGFKGGPGAAYGISGRSWDEGFWKPGERGDLTELIFVGPESPNPDQRPYPRDFNNFGPAVGFALQLP
ncbi:MAG: TonB-dependent receptor, partial [Acidobacteria bacterium]|nr:TonB-dependent receptor [Acidobacteriota bacterium]